MKIKKYTNGAWTDLDKPVKKYDTYTDEATSLPLTIETSKTDAVENYQIYGASGGVGEATSGSEPAGYKIPILNTSGVTENLVDISFFTNNYSLDVNTGLPTPSQYDRIATPSPINVSGISNVTLAWSTEYADVKAIYSLFSNNTLITRVANVYNNTVIDVSSADEMYVSLYNGLSSLTVSGIDYVMLVSGSTAPDHYIPHRYESNYDLFIGSTKLYEDEYLDFVEQKVYRYVDGVLTPQDPPTPFPTITTYIGENNISVDTTVQPEKVSVEYEDWKGVGDVEKYQNGEWSDNNGT